MLASLGAETTVSWANPRRRRGLLIALGIVVVLALTLALRLYSSARLERALDHFEAETGGLHFSALAPRRVEPRKDNAAFWLRAGADVLIEGDEDSTALLRQRVAAMGSPWSEADQRSFLALLGANEPARSLMDRAASLERSSFEVDYAKGADAEIPNFLPFIRAARFLGVECDFHHQRGDLNRALETLHLLERLTAVQRREPMLISLLTGVATERIYFDRVEAILGDMLDVVALRAIARDIDHLDAVTVATRSVLAAEVAASYSTVLRRRPGLLRSASGLDRLDVALFVESGGRLVDSTIHAMTETSPDLFERDVLRVRRLPPGIGTMARLTVPNYLHGIRRAQWVESARALGRLAVEVSLARVGHGRYPPSPAPLPVAVATGETATYEIAADGSLELAFPQAEASWAAEKARFVNQPGTTSGPDFNLRWRLPP
jgi:hypothetical protein